MRVVGCERAVPAAVVRRIEQRYEPSEVPIDFKKHSDSGHWILDDSYKASIDRHLLDWIGQPWPTTSTEI